MSEDFKKQIILRYCQEFLPIEEKTDRVIFKTSQDIQDELSLMVDVTVDYIAQVMVELGYELTISPEGHPAWMMESI